MSCVIFDNTTNNAVDNTTWFTNGNPPATVSSNMVNNTCDGDVVTSILTIESVLLNDNGNGYFCAPAFNISSIILE